MTTNEMALAEEMLPAAPSSPSMLPASAAARMAEVQAAAMAAERRPRSVTRAREDIRQACLRPRFAENAEYSYSKGGTEVTGPTVDLLKAITIAWGNVQFGWEEITRSGMYSTVRTFAWDVEKNVPSSLTFQVKHWIDSRGGGRSCRDEREIYECVANQAARRLRACLENVIPKDVVEEAVDHCRATLAGASEIPLGDQIKNAVQFATTLSVTADMIEEKFGRKVDALTYAHIAQLRRMFKAIKDGVATVEEHFPAKSASGDAKAPPKKTMDDLKKGLDAALDKKPTSGEPTDEEKARIKARELAEAEE